MYCLAGALLKVGMIFAGMIFAGEHFDQTRPNQSRPGPPRNVTGPGIGPGSESRRKEMKF